MEVTSTRDGTTGRVVVAGDIDSETSPALGEAMNSLLQDGVKDLNLVVDDVTFMSSAGLSVLISAHRGASRFQLQPGNRIVDRLIALTGLSMLYGTEESPSNP